MLNFFYLICYLLYLLYIATILLLLVIVTLGPLGGAIGQLLFLMIVFSLILHHSTIRFFSNFFISFRSLSFFPFLLSHLIKLYHFKIQLFILSFFHMVYFISNQKIHYPFHTPYLQYFHTPEWNNRYYTNTN